MIINGGFATIDSMTLEDITPMHHLMIMGNPTASGGRREALAVIATLSKGCDLDYVWKQVDHSLSKDAAGYYIRAAESGGEPPGRWWGPGAEALGFKSGGTVERFAYDLLFGQRIGPDGTQLGRAP